MGLNTYTIDRFIGIDQSRDENGLSPRYSCDAANIDTTDGKLSVAKGCEKFTAPIVPGTLPIDLLAVHKSSAGEIPIVITAGMVYACKSGAWQLVYNYPSLPSEPRYDSAMVRIGTTDYLVIADGVHQLIKYDGQTATLFGTEDNCSNISVSYLTMYRGRLFAAGNAQNPDRLYYSVLPGSGRTVENWGPVEASPAVEGGHAEVGSTGGDPIIAIRALSNQLLIFKKHGLYRLIGDRPSNFTIEHIDANIRSTLHTAIAVYGDVMYFVTSDGLYYYNGVTARPCPDMHMIKSIMAEADISDCRAATVRDKLYFTLKRDEEDEMIEYDLIERKYMLRNGFPLSDIAVVGEELLIVNSNRYIYTWGKGNDYDGEAINAHWCTPLTDLGDKSALKSPHTLYLRGMGSAIVIECEVGAVTSYYRTLLPESRGQVVEVPLCNEGRCMRLRFSNEAGGSFTLEGGVELCLGLRRRVS